MDWNPLEHFDQVIVTVVTDFSFDSNEQAPINRTAFGYSCPDRDAFCGHIRHIWWEDIVNLDTSGAATYFEVCFRLKLVYICLNKSIIHLLYFHWLMLLPFLTEIYNFSCNISKNLACLQSLTKYLANIKKIFQSSLTSIFDLNHTCQIGLTEMC